METVKIRCKTLCVGDWVANRNGSPMQIVAVDEDNAYACEGNEAYACEGNEERPWIFGDDEGYEPEPIILTPEILVKNGFYDRNTQWYYKRFWSNSCFDIAISLVYREIEVSKVYGAGTDYEQVEYDSAIVFDNDICAHTLQHALRLCGLNDLADNFKI